MKETLRCLWAIVKLFFKSLPVIRKGKKMSIPERWEYTYQFLRPECEKFMKATGSRIVYHGLENIPERKKGDMGLLFVGNHQSYLDIPGLLSVMDMPTSFVAKSELETTPMVGELIKNSGGLLIDQHNIRQNVEVIKLASENLQNGLNMVIFPEGARSLGIKMGEFKRGSLKAASYVGADIVPFRIENMWAVLEGNGKLKVVPRQVDIFFGKPISTKDMDRKEIFDLGGSMKDIIIALDPDDHGLH